MISTIRQALDERKVRYLLAGGWNTVFGYSTGVALYYAFSNYLHVIVIATLANIIAITMSFSTYKLFVFQTHGNWLHEYFRSYLVYGGMALVGIGLLWIMVDGLNIPFWLAQGLVILSTVVISYIGHSRFTFRNKE
jgi:putative flippase GtrA